MADIHKMLVASSGEESKFIIRGLQGKLRIGMAESTVQVWGGGRRDTRRIGIGRIDLTARIDWTGRIDWTARIDWTERIDLTGRIGTGRIDI